jgi:TM2 domain-containing membrane protein YozV
MYCSNCGAQIDDKAVVCVKCGVATGNFKSFNSTTNKPAEGFDWLSALLLCFFLGAFGAHNFYTRKTGVAIIHLFTFGGFGIWALVDFIMIITETYRDGYGRPLVRK